MKTASLLVLLTGIAAAQKGAEGPTIPTITTTTLPAGFVGSPYNESLAVVGGTPPYVWTLHGSLPNGLLFTAQGLIFGTPTITYAQPFSFGVTAQDAQGNTSPVATLSIVINPQILTITTPPALAVGIATVEYPPRILSASGGLAPYAFSASSGLPPGMTLVNGVIGGTPTTTGSYQIKVNVTDSAGAQASATLAVTIRPATTDLQLSEGSLSFSLADIAAVPPSAKTIKVQSSLVSQQLSFTTSISPAVAWLSVTGGSTTPAQLTVAITNAALPLNPGIYSTTLAITCATSPCVGKTLNVPITLTITVTPARLRVPSDLLSYTTDPTIPLSAQNLIQELQIRNAGGASLTINSVTCGEPWCDIDTFPTSVAGGVTTPVAVGVDPGSLSPGSYRTTVVVDSAAGSITIPLTLVIPRKPAIHLASSGAQFTMPAGGAPAKSTGSFRMTATGGSISWTATADSTPAWLKVSTPSGTAAPSLPGAVQFAIDDTIVSGLKPGTYYGSIQLAANGITNSPQEFRVIMQVTKASDPVRPEVEPGGFVLTTSTLKKVTATASVLAGSTAPVTYQAAVATSSGGSWLSVSPAIGTASSSSPGISTITADPTGLAPGVYLGGISYAFSGAAIRTLNVTLVVTPPGAGASIVPTANSQSASSAGFTPHGYAPQASCSPSTLAIGQTGLVNDFSEPTFWPVPIAINLLNDCGAYVSNAQVVVTFNNGDPPLALPLVDSSTGLYAATWTPRRTSSEVTISTTATVPGLPVATAVLSGEVLPNAVPSLNAWAILNVFNPLVGAALAPGTVVALYGSNLASSTTIPTTIPLPTQATGTQVIIGGIAAPLYYAAEGQINAQIPFELDPDSQYQVVVSASGALTTPQTIQLAPASPGVAANPDTTILAQHADYSPINAASPARPGEYIILYSAGMGATDNPVPSGAGSPSNPLARTSPPPSLTIDSVVVPVYFAGLTPGAVGLYQINVQLPSNLSNGNHQIAVSQTNGQAASNSALLPVHN